MGSVQSGQGQSLPRSFGRAQEAGRREGSRGPGKVGYTHVTARAALHNLAVVSQCARSKHRSLQKDARYLVLNPAGCFRGTL